MQKRIELEVVLASHPTKESVFVFVSHLLHDLTLYDIETDFFSKTILTPEIESIIWGVGFIGDGTKLLLGTS